MSRSRCTASMESSVKSMSPFLFFGIVAAIQCCSGFAYGFEVAEEREEAKHETNGSHH
jgi:hypothetical protein